MIKITFEQGTSFSPRIVRIVTDSILSQITTAGWLNSAVNEGISIQPTDSVLIAYNDGSGATTTNYFQVSISPSTKQVTLSLETANFPQPGATSGSIVISNGTAWISSTSLWPNTVGTASNILYSNGTANTYLATANYGVLVTSATGVPSISAGGQIPGTRTNDDATSGNIGEIQEVVIPVGSEVTLSVSGTTYNIGNFTLSPGDWDISSSIVFSIGSGAVTVSYSAALSTTSATLPTLPANGRMTQMQEAVTGPFDISIPVGSVSRVSVAASTTSIFLLVAKCVYTGTPAPTAYGYMLARRVR